MTSSISSSAIDTNLQYDKDQDTRMLKVEIPERKGRKAIQPSTGVGYQDVRILIDPEEDVGTMGGGV